MSFLETQGRESIICLYNELNEKYKKKKEKNKQLILDIQSLENKIKCYLKEIESVRIKNQELEEKQNILIKQNLMFKSEVQTLKDCMSKLTYKNRGILKEYFDNSNEDFVVSLDSVILSLQYFFIFKKLFEMNVYDYIIDRQVAENKTNEYDNMLINLCDSFSNELINKYMNVETNIFSIRDFKKDFKTFTRPYLDKPGYSIENKKM